MILPRHLIVFTRPARLGAVKTRLAAGIGTSEAWRFHRRTVRTLLMKVARDTRWRTWLALPPEVIEQNDRSWPIDLPRLDQGEGDIGQRMVRSFDQLPPGPAVLIGGDIPSIEPFHIAEAFEALGAAEIVFGPAADGGFWLVGFARLGRRLDPFSGVRWSTEHALADARAHLPRDTRVALVETLADVDDAAAYERWRAGA
ncbi:MAG: glycosyltransferase [Alphaproteobacteria bacterium]|nr:glycosyltransferase [Alphaproteobacteria bacterium]